MEQLPFYLKKYIFKQDDRKYTPIDHACWRYILRSLKNFHARHAHESYVPGLEATGIEVDCIPRIDHISEKLQEFGWRALPVSGFIPPAAFMELQALNVLPIASDMRSIDHLQYTPAPDIVHEAAGHAPLLSNTEYADYLRQYAQVAKKAIIGQEDLDLYEAIRVLSDIKENPLSTPEEIKAAENRLEYVAKAITYVSEATQLGRMNWWTAEYGLIGDIKNPKIFGAGLLSSVGESRYCLSDKVKKVPLTLDCVNVGYDITEPQPQLFVTSDFKHLGKVLEEFAATMAFRVGGAQGLEKIKKARTVNTVQYDSGLQVSGKLKDYILDKQGNSCYLQFTGPTQLSFQDQLLPGHGKEYHAEGFGSPVGPLPASAKELKPSQEVLWKWNSGLELKGRLLSKVEKNNEILILTFEDCLVTLGRQILFDPSWGKYDMAVGTKIVSVFGGAADHKAYGEKEDFVVAQVGELKYSDQQKRLHQLYQQIRDHRQNTKKISDPELEQISKELKEKFPTDWLLTLEIFEVGHKEKKENLKAKAKAYLQEQITKSPQLKEVIEEGLFLVTN